MDNDRNPAGEGWVPATVPPDTRTFTDLGEFTVDGETFSVRRSDEDRTTHYDWISGPNEGYGFSSFSSSPELDGHDDHVTAIRDFLAMIDPATRFIGNT